MTQHVDEVWAFLSEDADGNEGLCACRTAGGWVPLVAADRAVVEVMEPVAGRLARECGMAIRLVRFGARQEVRVLPGRED